MPRVNILKFLGGGYADEVDQMMKQNAAFEAERRKTLFDTLVHNRQVAEIKANMGKMPTGNEVMPAGVQGPPAPGQAGTGYFAGMSDPNEAQRLQAQVLNANVNPQAYGQQLTDTMQVPWQRERQGMIEGGLDKRNMDDNSRLLQTNAATNAQRAANKVMEGQQQIALAEYNRTHRAPPEIGKTYDFLTGSGANTQKVTMVWDGDKFFEGGRGSAYSPQSNSSGGGHGAINGVDMSNYYDFMQRENLNPQQNSRQAMIDAGIINAYAAAHDGALPPRKWYTDAIAATARETKGASSTKVMTQGQAIEDSFTRIDDYMKAQENRGLSPIAPVAWLQDFKDKLTGDPRRTEAMSARFNLLMSYAAATKGNGITDISLKMEEEANHPKMSPAQTIAFVNMAQRELDKKAGIMNSIYGFNLKQHGSVAPGRVGVDTPSLPIDNQSGMGRVVAPPTVSSYALFKAQTGRK